MCLNCSKAKITRKLNQIIYECTLEKTSLVFCCRENAVIHLYIFELEIYFKYLYMLFHCRNSLTLKSNNKKVGVKMNEIVQELRKNTAEALLSLQL